MTEWLLRPCVEERREPQEDQLILITCQRQNGQLGAASPPSVSLLRVHLRQVSKADRFRLSTKNCLSSGMERGLSEKNTCPSRGPKLVRSSYTRRVTTLTLATSDLHALSLVSLGTSIQTQTHK